VFVCFEGIDGAGKSTQAELLLQDLKRRGVPAELVADPGTTKIGAAIRSLLLDSDVPISGVAQMLLFSAARAELSNYINDKIHAKKVVICDRWLFSTLVYQGVLNQIARDFIVDVFDYSGCPFPDLCFVLDISPESAKDRMGLPQDRYERRSLSSRKKMREAYLALAHEADFSSVTHVLNAERPRDQTAAAVSDAVTARLREFGFFS
jgi:dTMP kinase